MKTKKLKWKVKTCDDLSAEWLEATVKPLGWTYVIDESYEDGKFMCALFLSEKTCEEVRINNKNFSEIEKAKQYCEEHLEATYKKLRKIFND